MVYGKGPAGCLHIKALICLSDGCNWCQQVFYPHGRIRDDLLCCRCRVPFIDNPLELVSGHLIVTVAPIHPVVPAVSRAPRSGFAGCRLSNTAWGLGALGL